jgi:hypothetical protein
VQVQLVLKNWSISRDEKTKLPTICGKYAVMMGDKEIATQHFNDGYNCKELPFSNEAIAAVRGLEKIISTELEKVLT